ncbi:MAG: putative nucleotidyltransferase [Candidatus Woesearchaeota archaeon]|jgi:predicted nucleotidyltransferase
MVLKLKHKILKLIIENKNKQFSIRAISKLLKVDYKNVYGAVQSVKESIRVQKQGQSCLISYSSTLTPDLFFVEEERKKEIQSKIKLILKDIESQQNPFFIAILFGSYAKNTQTKNSDIDICIIYDNEDTDLINTLSIHPKIQIHGFFYKDFIKMLQLKTFNVGHEIVKEGIPIHNVEGYYKVLKHE